MDGTAPGFGWAYKALRNLSAIWSSVHALEGLDDPSGEQLLSFEGRLEKLESAVGSLRKELQRLRHIDANCAHCRFGLRDRGCEDRN